MHLDPLDQCSVIIELVDKMRVGAQLWFGGNALSIWENITEFTPKMMLPAQATWAKCFRRAFESNERWQTGEVAIVWETLEDRLLFQANYDAHSSALFAAPAY